MVLFILKPPADTICHTPTPIGVPTPSDGSFTVSGVFFLKKKGK